MNPDFDILKNHLLNAQTCSDDEASIELFSAVDILQKFFNKSVFEIILSERARQMPKEAEIENIEDMLASSEYEKISQHSFPQGNENTISDNPEILEYLHQVEIIAHKIYKNMGIAWTNYELYKNTERAKTVMQKSDNSISETKSEGVTAELVSEIATDERYFHTLGIPVSCQLKYAVKDQFLRLILEKTWWEALSLLSLSEQGRHAICHKTETESNNPILLATALIQDIPETGGEDRLLTRSDFFRTDDWKVEIDRKDVMQALENYFEKNPAMEKIDVNYDCIPEHPHSVKELEEGFIRAVGIEHIAEWLRLTVEGKTEIEKLKNLYNAIGKMAHIQSKNDLVFSFVITDKTITINILDLLEALTGRKCYLLYSEYIIDKKKGISTCKIISFNKSLDKAVEEIDTHLIIRGLALLKNNSLQDVIIKLKKDIKI